jgi:hypothetical protein
MVTDNASLSSDRGNERMAQGERAVGRECGITDSGRNTGQDYSRPIHRAIGLLRKCRKGAGKAQALVAGSRKQLFDDLPERDSGLERGNKTV